MVGKPGRRQKVIPRKARFKRGLWRPFQPYDTRVNCQEITSDYLQWLGVGHRLRMLRVNP